MPQKLLQKNYCAADTMAKKKSLLKKIFGKSKQPKNEAKSTLDGGSAAGAGRVSPEPSTKANDSVAADPIQPTAPQAPTGHRSDSATLDTESDQSGSPRILPKSSEAKAGEEAPLALQSNSGFLKTSSANEDALASTADQLGSHPHLTAYDQKNEYAVDAETEEKAIEEGNESTDLHLQIQPTRLENESLPQENEATFQKEADTDQENEATHKGEEAAQEKEVEKKKDKKAWAEERMSQMYSSSKIPEKPKLKIQVGERRKWIEGLSTPKSQPSSPRVPDDVKKLGKLSDRMKAVEQALHDKGTNSSPSKEASPTHTPNREKAAAQRKAVEDMLKRHSSPKAFVEAEGKSTTPASTPSPGKACSQRKVVEEMLQKQQDPKAFFEAKEKSSPQATSSPGREGLASRKKWVLETLEKQNDPKLFLDQKEQKHTVDLAKENFGERKDFEEHKKRLEVKAKDAEDNVRAT